MTIYFLYIKHCEHCDLKYLGHTVQDPFKYTGSGKRWRAHLRKHKSKFHTEVIGIYDTKQQLTEAGLFYSGLYDVVKSQDWANIRPESGTGGFQYVNYDPEFQAKAQHAFKKKLQEDPEFKKYISTCNSVNNKLKWQDPEYREKMLVIAKEKTSSPEYRAKVSAGLKRKFQDPEYRDKISVINKKRYEDPEYRAKMLAIRQSPEFRAKVSASCTGNSRTYVCTHCSISFKGTSPHGKHFHKCKYYGVTKPN